MKRLDKATVKVGKWKGHGATITQPQIRNSRQIGVLVEGNYVESFLRKDLIIHKRKRR